MIDLNPDAVGVRILGIVNVTRDSFSDGGRYFDPDAAIAHALKLRAQGAAMIDLGPASTHPDAEAVGPEEEIRRLEPVVTALLAEGLALSIDTYEPATQRWALKRGLAINDIQGFPDPALYPVLADSDTPLIVMHSIQRLGKATRTHSDPATIFDVVTSFLDARVHALTRAGVARERLVLDPGMGFFLGSDPACSTTILARLPELRARYDLPLLVSVSRKSFLRRIAECTLEEVGPATLAAELYCATQGVDWIRTHDVAALRRATTVLDSIARG